MSRTVFPLYAGDISAFARSLNSQITASQKAPSHVELLNMLARSAGYRNYQHLRAQAQARDRLTSPRPKPVGFEQVQRLLRYFDATGRLVQWPGKFSQRVPCLWVLWSRLPARKTLSEQQVNQFLQANHLFGDPALLRRELCDLKLVTRTADCKEYRRKERRPPDEVCELMRQLETRRAS
jgi:hypothetical protein